MILSRNFTLTTDITPDTSLPAIIGYKTILPTSTLVASSEVAGSPVELAASYLTGDYWRTIGTDDHYLEVNSTLQTVDYYGIAAHNLAGQTVQLQVWDGEYWTTIDEILVLDQAPIMRVFDEVQAARFRFFFPACPALVIGVIFLGRLTRLERGVFVGHRPINLNRRDDIVNSITEGGQFIGRSIVSEGGETEIALSNLSANWMREEWAPFQLHARLRPFFFAWHQILYPWEVTYCWSQNIPQPQIMAHEFYTATMQVRGLI